MIYLKGLKSGITCFFSCNIGKIKIDSDNNFPLDKRLTLHNIITLIISVINKDQNHYHYSIFSEKCLYQ